MLVLGILIFFARIIDVSLDTLRMKALLREQKFVTASIAFVEIIVYTLGASQAFKYVSNITVLLFYAMGYAAGNFVGILIDNKISQDDIFALIIADHDEWLLADALRGRGFGVTTAKGYGMNGAEKAQLKIVIKKRRFSELAAIIREIDPVAYMVTMDVRGMKQ